MATAAAAAAAAPPPTTMSSALRQAQSNAAAAAASTTGARTGSLASQLNSAAAAAAQSASNAALSDLDNAALSLESDQIASVRLDGLALTKIVKHSKDAHPNIAVGTLMGLDIAGALEVSNVFALPNGALKGGKDRDGEDDEEDKGSKSATRYTAQMIRLLRDVNADANAVGLYQSCFLGSFLNSSVLENLAAVAGLMEKEGASGRGKGVLVVHDLASSAAGNPSIRAYRLSPSFIEAYRSSAPKFTTTALINQKLTFSNVLVEIPISLHNTALLDAFVSGLNVPTIGAGISESLVAPTTRERLLDAPRSALTSNAASSSALASSSSLGARKGGYAPNSALLSLSHTPLLASSLEKTLDSLDEYLSDASNVGYQLRQLAREKTRIEGNAARRKAENLAREAQGLSALPVEDTNAQLKALAQREPSRLEGLALLGALDESAKRLAELGGNASVGLFASKTGAI